LGTTRCVLATDLLESWWMYFGIWEDSRQRASRIYIE